MFKIGDIIEGETNNRWVRGRVEKIDRTTYGVFVLKTRELEYDCAPLHNIGFGSSSPHKYWYVFKEEAVLSKPYIVSEIIKDL